jgi:hypothetical protein
MGLWDSIRSLLRGASAQAPRSNLQRTWHFAHDPQWETRTLDPASLAVFADWLEENGDTRAELIRLAPTPAQFETFVRANAEPLFAQLARKLLGPGESRFDGTGEEQLELEWKDGVLRGASVRTSAVLADAAFLMRQPIARTINRLALGIQAPMTPLIEVEGVSALAAASQHVDSLFLGDFAYPTECEMSWGELGDVSCVWTAFPKLRELKLRGVVQDIGRIYAPELTHFTHETSGLTKLELASVVKAHWPRLTHLEVWFGDENYGSDVVADDVLPLLNARLPNLERLALKNFNFTDRLVELLAPSPLLTQVKRLDLSLGTMTEEGAETLLANRARFTHLAHLDLSDNFIPPAHQEQLKAVFRSVELGTQKVEDDGFRYVSVSE